MRRYLRMCGGKYGGGGVMKWKYWGYGVEVLGGGYEVGGGTTVPCCRTPLV